MVGPIAPAADGLAERDSRDNEVRPDEKRLTSPPTQEDKGRDSRHNGAVDGQATEAHVERLIGVCEEVVPAQEQIVGTRADDT